MIKLWGTLKRRHKIIKQQTVTAPSGSLGDVYDAVDDICRLFDIARPIWLNKHEAEIEKFGMTSFAAGDFVEAISFDRFDVEILKEKAKSRDPRNDFSYS